MENKIVVAEFTNAAEGTQALVIETATGYRVLLRDTDADQIVPTMWNYPATMKPQAMAMAKKVANL